MSAIKIKVYRSNNKTGEWYIEDKLEYIETIHRKPFNRGFVGNFVPHYCRYKGRIYGIYGSLDYSYMHGYEGDAYINVDKPLSKVR